MGKLPMRRTLLTASSLDPRRSPAIGGYWNVSQGLSLNGAAASGLLDLSGKGWNMVQATGANQMDYHANGQNGRPYLQGGGALKWLATSANYTALNGAPGMTVMVVGNMQADATGGAMMAQDAGGSSTVFILGQSGGSTGNFNYQVYNAAASQVNLSGVPTPVFTTTAIWEAVYDLANSTDYVNGTQFQTGVLAGTALSAIATTLTIGNKTRQNGSAQFYAGLIWARALGAQERLVWRTWLNAMFHVF